MGEKLPYVAALEDILVLVAVRDWIYEQPWEISNRPCS